MGPPAIFPEVPAAVLPEKLISTLGSTESVCSSSDDDSAAPSATSSSSSVTSTATSTSSPTSILETAIHVMSTEAAALTHLSLLYQRDATARRSFVSAVSTVANAVETNGKLVICGVGKSGKIAQKLVATMNSLGVLAVYLHPTEALHGDLGLVRPCDVLLLITFSGRTSELGMLIPHLPESVPIITMTGYPCAVSSPLTGGRKNAILLPTPVHESEEKSFGLSAPTTSTTVALALGDALSLAVARSIHGNEDDEGVEGTPKRKTVKEVFGGFHPGGAIGAKVASK